MSIELIEPKDFDFVSTKLRNFFKSKGFIEVMAQHRLSILAACEDPDTISIFNYCNKLWPLPQTSQMWLEYELLTKPDVPGYFSYTTSYRAEPNPIQGRHNVIFPMIEFEFHGDMQDLLRFEKELMEFLGFGKKESFHEGNYIDVCDRYNVNEITHDQEMRLYEEYGPVFFLKNFPESSSPFWNMKRNDETNLVNKIDVIVSGIETIGSAEREIDVSIMKTKFETISDGKYAEKLYSMFGRDRVTHELDDFLKHKFIKRVGGGIGVTRLIRALRMERLI